MALAKSSGPLSRPPKRRRFVLPPKGRLAFAHDVAMAGVAFVLALALRLGNPFDYFAIGDILTAALLFMAVAGVMFVAMRMYQGIWRYASMRDLLTITKAVTLTILVFTVLMFTLTRLEAFPRSLPFINWFVLMALLGGPRFLYRIAKDRRFDWSLDRGDETRVPVLLAGAGDGAELFLRALNRAGGGGYQPVGIVSDTGARVGRTIHGVAVMGTFADIEPVVGQLNDRGITPQRLVLTRDDLDGDRVKALLAEAEKHGMTLARAPKPTDLKSGEADGLTIRPVDVADLLGRPQMPLDRDAMAAMIRGRRVLVTGAGGSIGSELARQIAGFTPGEIGLLDQSEFNLYTIDMEIAASAPGLARRLFLADVRERDRIAQIVKTFAPDVVFHAAALKHVPMVELNPAEGVMTNVTGTVNVADACVTAGVAAMVMISTDKAVNPTNVMGATKRIAEQYCQGLDLDGGVKTRFVTVRFGNVLGSTGSVVPLFQRQLAEGGPLTVTHPDMTRYFMTVREAVELVLQAAAVGSRGMDEDGKIFVLDMGTPVKIVDLARQMIRLQGLEPDRDIDIIFTGVRPGEKLFEEMFHTAEPPVPTGTPGLLLAAPRSGDLAALKRALADLETACRVDDSNAIARGLKGLVPEYAPETPAL